MSCTTQAVGRLNNQTTMNYGKNPNSANNTSSNGYNKAAAPMFFDGGVKASYGQVDPKTLTTNKLAPKNTKDNASVKSVVSAAQPIANPARSGNGRVTGGWDG